jgi:hypothetical protein
MDRTPTFTWGQVRELFEQWSDRYLASEHAWRIEGRPVCAFNNLTDFVARYGAVAFAVLLRYGAQVIERQTGSPPFILGIIGRADRRNVSLANRLPLDAVTGYGLLPNWLGAPIQDYDALMDQRAAEWDAMQRRLTVPFYPVVCAGWDASIRGRFRGTLRAEDGYPYSPVVVGVSPESFGRYLDLAIAFNRRWSPRPNLVFLHAWNEWTECSVLAPSDRFGSTLLDEVSARRGLGDHGPSSTGRSGSAVHSASDPS